MGEFAEKSGGGPPLSKESELPVNGHLRTESAVVAAPTFSFGAIQSFNVTYLVGHDRLNFVDETSTTGGVHAEAPNGIAFGQVIGNDQDFPIIAQSIGGAFDHVVGGFALN